MPSYNRILIMGNLTRNAEYKQLDSGAVTRLGVATNRQYKNRQTGAVIQEVCFIDVDVFGPQAENCRQLQKGRPVFIEGRLKFDTWQTQDGQTRSKHWIIADRVVFLGSQQTAEQESSTDVAALADSMLSADTVSAAQPIMPRKKRATTTAPEVPEFTFKDEPPFQDDLPF